MSTYVNLQVSIDIGCVLIILLSVLIIGAEINELFMEHKYIILNLKKTLLFIKSNYEKIIVKKQEMQGDILKAYVKVFLSERQKSGDEGVLSHIDDLIEEFDAIMERLDHDYEHRPLRLLGFKATYGLLNTLYTGIFSVGFAMVQQIVTSDS